MKVRIPRLTEVHSAVYWTTPDDPFRKTTCGELRTDFEDVDEDEPVTCPKCLRWLGERGDVSGKGPLPAVRAVGAGVWGCDPDSPDFRRKGMVTHIGADAGCWVQWDEQDIGGLVLWDALSRVDPGPVRKRRTE